MRNINIIYKTIITIDLEAIKEIYRSCGWKSYLNDDNKLHRAYKNTLFLHGAYDGEALAGFIRCVGDGEHIILVQDLIVHPKYQKQGIGTTLFQYVLEKYKEVRMFMVVTDAYDEVDNKFYQKNRLEEIAEKQMVAYIR